MDGWVRADYRYGLRMGRVYLPREDMPLMESMRLFVSRGADDPKKAGEFFEGLLGRYRPEWVGGTLVALRFDFARACWEFLYAHPAMPLTREGEELARVPLIPGPGDGADPATVFRSVAAWEERLG